MKIWVCLLIPPVLSSLRSPVAAGKSVTGLLFIVLALSRIRANCKDLQGVFHGFKAELLADFLLESDDSFFAEFNNMSAFDTDEMIVIRHTGGELKMCAFTLKAMFHEDGAFGEQVESGVNRRAGNPVAFGIHIEIQLIGTEVFVELGDPVENSVTLLRVTILLAFEKVCKLLLERFKVDWSRGCIHEIKANSIIKDAPK